MQPQMSILPRASGGAPLGDTGAPRSTLEEARGSAPLAGSPADSQQHRGERQPQLPPLPGDLTAVSDADNVRGQEATHLKPYLECRVET